MTTERRPAKREAWFRASPLELRLYVAALLAAVYTISWRAIGGHAAAPQPPPTPSMSPRASEAQAFVWIDSLPPGLRPTVALPAGWQLASRQQSPVTEPARVVRVPGRRVPRVRTRSS